jgi:hypothetical protein
VQQWLEIEKLTKLRQGENRKRPATQVLISFFVCTACCFANQLLPTPPSRGSEAMSQISVDTIHPISDPVLSFYEYSKKPLSPLAVGDNQQDMAV